VNVRPPFADASAAFARSMRLGDPRTYQRRDLPASRERTTSVSIEAAIARRTESASDAPSASAVPSAAAPTSPEPPPMTAGRTTG
jgi:hypothetical protein